MMRMMEKINVDNNMKKSFIYSGFLFTKTIL